jgi:hypothetical protein
MLHGEALLVASPLGRVKAVHARVVGGLGSLGRLDFVLSGLAVRVNAAIVMDEVFDGASWFFLAG